MCRSNDCVPFKYLRTDLAAVVPMIDGAEGLQARRLISIELSGRVLQENKRVHQQFLGISHGQVSSDHLQSQLFPYF